MSVKKLTPQEQIDLLNEIKSTIREAFIPFRRFLCNAYFCVTNGGSILSPGWELRGRNFKRQVPLFTFENAKQFGANRKHENNGGWFKAGVLEPRIAFLDWMIEENQKLIQK